MIYGLGCADLHAAPDHRHQAAGDDGADHRRPSGGRADAHGTWKSWVDLIAAVTRSQIAAIISNVAIALPTALGIAVLWSYLAGHPMIDAGRAPT